MDGKPLGERNPKWLNDLYVRFTRLSQHLIERSGAGVHGFITNHSYIDNPTFRRMRRALLSAFDSLAVLDLRGNTKKKETALREIPLPSSARPARLVGPQNPRGGSSFHSCAPKTGHSGCPTFIRTAGCRPVAGRPAFAHERQTTARRRISPTGGRELRARLEGGAGTAPTDGVRGIE